MTKGAIFFPELNICNNNSNNNYYWQSYFDHKLGFIGFYSRDQLKTSGEWMHQHQRRKELTHS